MILCNYWPFISRPLPRAVPENAARRQQPHSKQCVDCFVVLFFCSAAALHCATVYRVPKKRSRETAPSNRRVPLPGPLSGHCALRPHGSHRYSSGRYTNPLAIDMPLSLPSKVALDTRYQRRPWRSPRQSAATKMAFPNDSHCSNRQFDLATLVLHQSVQSVSQPESRLACFGEPRCKRQRGFGLRIAVHRRRAFLLSC